MEWSSYLFLHCHFILSVWSKILGWFEINFIAPQRLFERFEFWSGEIWNKKLRKGFWLICHASIWVIWKARNDIIFNDCIKGLDELVEDIKVLSCRQWSLQMRKTPPCCSKNGYGYGWFVSPVIRFCRGCFLHFQFVQLLCFSLVWVTAISGPMYRVCLFFRPYDTPWMIQEVWIYMLFQTKLPNNSLRKWGGI